MTNTNEVQLSDVDGRENEESVKCESCNASMINGIFCHETGCPDAWKNHKYSCKNCGCDFTPESKDDSFVVCGHVCFVNYYGHECNCDECTGGYPFEEEDDNYGYSDQKNFD